MKQLQRVALLALAVAFGLTVGAAVSQDKKDAFDEKAFFEAMTKAGTPGEHHKKLDVLAGTWTYDGKFWMDPSKPATELSGTAERKWILGGRYLHEEYKGPGFAGEPFHGIGITGYDNVQKKYTTVWIDSMSTSTSLGAGTLDATGKVLTFTHAQTCPVTGNPVKMRDVITIHDNDTIELVSYREEGGKEMKAMQIVQKRKN